jgi:hypothetical protein
MADFSTLVLTVNAIVITHNQIHNIITISRRENEASTMNITLITPTGLQDLDYWAGKDISLVIDGVTAFTGVVDIPEIDVVYKKITLMCTDKRREILNDQNVSTVGFHSDAIFSETENTIEELEQRLTTIPSAADIKPDGSYVITDINPKTTPDFTLLDADVYRRKPTVSPTSRGRLTNQVNLNFKLRYSRRRHRERNFKMGSHSFCDHVETAGSKYTSKTDFYNYIDSMDWHLNESSVIFEDLPPSGLITSCNVTDFIWYNFNDIYALWVTYSSAIRFIQTITEDFTITVKAPQSITQYGVIEWDQDNGVDIEYDQALWESQKTYEAPTGMTQDANDYYTDEDDTTIYDDAVETAINIANTKIIKSHRDTQVNFETDLRLDFNLTHTIELSTVPLDAKGKVTSIFHALDINNRKGNTTTEISLSTAQGTQVSDSLTVPTRPSVPIIADAYSDPILIAIDIYGDGDVVTPSIDDTSRDEQEVNQVVNYDIEIQDDTFGVTF